MEEGMDDNNVMETSDIVKPVPEKKSKSTTKIEINISDTLESIYGDIE
jgi:hypothetical protein